jgi:hypothetical protein
MSAVTYAKGFHTHVWVNIPEKDSNRWNHPLPIVLHTGNRVWVAGNYAMKIHPSIVQVGDCLSNGFDEHGNCILSVPEEWCWFMDEREVADFTRKLVET